MALADHALDWGVLLDCIDSRCVIPIVGRELLTVSLGGKEMLLERYLAERLAEKLGVATEKLDGNLNLQAVANAYLDPSRDSGDIYRLLNSIMRECRFATPPGLAKLAEITGFDLFVTTTFDSLLVQALNERHRGRVLESFPKSRDHSDIPEDWKDEGCVPVYYLFGKLSTLGGDYAVTEADYLEFIAKLQSKEGRPNNLFDAFRENHLLFLGCSFEDWLERFFIRTVRDEPFSPLASHHALQVVADREAGRGGSLTVFLHLYRMQVFGEGGPIKFVDELYERWRDRHPKTAEPPPGASADRTPYQIFLSYDRHDLAAATKIHEILKEEGLSVFFDQNLESFLQGEDWDGKIRRTIRDCAVFIPLISQHALNRHKGYLIKEWKLAISESVSRTKSTRFIQPVSLDQTKAIDEQIDVDFPEFKEPEWGSFADERLAPGNFARQLTVLLRELAEKEKGIRR